MATTYYPYWFRLDNADGYLLWYTDDSTDSAECDGVLLDGQGRLLTFCHLAELHDCAVRLGLSVEPEVNPEPLDLDVVQRWLEAASKSMVDCETFLEAWNLFSDLAATVQGGLAHIDERNEDSIYNKLFWGNNLPALTPPGKHYKPTWTKSEVGRLRKVLRRGMRLFPDRLAMASTETAGVISSTQ